MEKDEEYFIGIDYGTSNSCVGVFWNGVPEIVPNKIGETTTPSIVQFITIDEYAEYVVGEDALIQKGNDKNLIYEVKRFIGLTYDEFKEAGYGDYLNYDIVNMGGFPKIKIEIGGKVSYFSPEEISSFIIKKMVQCAQDFIYSLTKKKVIIKHAIVTVPAHFNKMQIGAVKNAAKLAGIELPRIINEPTAAGLAYGIGNTLVPEDNNQKNSVYSSLYSSVTISEQGIPAPPIMLDKNKSEEKAIIFDLGGGTLDITIVKIRKESDGNIVFEIIATDGDTHLGGSDFDNALINFCIKKFCENNNFKKEEDIRNDKLACKRLKIKCENAKKLLSEVRKVEIKIDNFYNKKNLIEIISRDDFNYICNDLYKRIENLIKGLLNDIHMKKDDIEEIILIGGGTKILGVKDLLARIFDESKIKDNINQDEAVAIGATINSAKIVEKKKLPFTLQDITAYNIGIQAKFDGAEGDMYPFIRRFTKIPTTSYSEKEYPFSVLLTKEVPDIKLKVYEGNNAYVKNNTLLGEVIFENIPKIGKIEYKLKFSINVNGVLTITLTIDELKLKREKEINKFTHGILDESKKKVKACKSERLKPLGKVIEKIEMSKKKISESLDDEKYKHIQNCCKNYRDLISNYLEFTKSNELALQKVFIFTKELFSYFIQMFYKSKKPEKDFPEIVNMIKEYMGNVVSECGYMGELLEIISEIKQKPKLKKYFYEIFINYMDLMNAEEERRKNIKEYKRFYSKLYSEAVYFAKKKYITEDDEKNMDSNLYQRYMERKGRNEKIYKNINSYTDFVEELVKKGKFLFGNTGYTAVGKQIEEANNLNNKTEEDFLKLLDLFRGIADNYEKNKNSIGEAFCLSNIININYKYLKSDINNIRKDIERVKEILDIGKYDIYEYEWIQEIKKVIKEIESDKSFISI